MKDIKYIILSLLFIQLTQTFTNKAFAQSSINKKTSQIKADTIRMKVIFIACPTFIQNKGVTDNPTKYFVYPLQETHKPGNSSNLDPNKFLSVLNNNVVNNEIFLYDDDQVMKNMLEVVKKTGLNFTYFTDRLAPMGNLNDNVKTLPAKFASNKLRYYSAYVFDSLWLKYTTYRSYQTNSAKAKKTAEKPCNYYLLNKIYSKEKIK